ncbi:SulP family inorganic anion transporter [Paracoccus sanguinis]|uniref:Sulfate permease n=1 Tax=Paracoccus sanguinis TaxID=1545044 RepID=A0A099GED6_9RHOB|nr:SulP family inorganic anion transporter [Paracoccus sanguinis]KGJ15781.1 sulfate permease [Paracoccus sanguinis]KGJ21114.1 sulfate permease [Paracoccus sanguinis]
MKPKILSTLPGYRGADFLADAVAGVTVAMVAIPLSLAIAIASGVPPGVGLVTAIVGGFLISALGGSRVQIGGPTGAFIVVVAGVVAAHGQDGLILATLVAGAVLVVAGALRAGRLIALVPEPVIDGFTIGIGIIIAASQLPDALGLHLAHVPAEFLPKLGAIWAARGQIDPAALGVTVGTMALIVLLRRAFPRFPGLIVAVGATSALALALGLGVDTIGSRFGALPNRLPMPALPEMSYARVVELLPSALIIAFLAGIESLLSALVADRMIGGRHRPNAELMAQGWANIGSALMGGLPATGAIARTATNVKAGGRTPVAGLVHALVILVVMMVAAPLAGALAMPALAGLLLLTAWNMTEPAKWRHRRALRRGDQGLLLLTLGLTVLADLTIAIGVGVGAGLALRLARRDVPSDWTPPAH